jgi:RsiW-degrading membrane proteinase PrsW (M82 family)
MTARARWASAIGVGVAGIVAAAAAFVLGGRTPPVVFVLAAAAAPATAGLAVWALLGGRFPARALVGGATIGPVVALMSHAAVAAFATAFLLGFADTGRALLHVLRVDPRISAVLASPWVLLAFVEYSVVAPITEEGGKYLGSRLQRPTDRREAFLAGVAAGAGFAVVEDLLYAVAAALWGGPWLAVAIVRVTGAAVHPLAAGLVALGWWDRSKGDGRAAIRGWLAGAGTHALWNGVLVALLVVETTVGRGATLPGAGIAAIAFAAALGVVLSAALWTTARSVATGADPVGAIRGGDARHLAAWIALSASLLVPTAVLILAFPAFRP